MFDVLLAPVLLALASAPAPVAGPAPVTEKVAQGSEPTPAAPAAADAGTPAPEEPARFSRSTEALPPSLTSAALQDELARSAREARRERQRLNEERQKLEGERKALEAERTRLSQLAADVEKSRALLKDETARLEALIARVGNVTPQAAGGAAPATRPEPPPLNRAQVESLAKTVKAMKADQAAVLITKLDTALAVRVLQKMKPADAGAVLERLRPDLAAELVSSLATLPGTAGGR